jgi:integrase
VSTQPRRGVQAEVRAQPKTGPFFNFFMTPMSRTDETEHAYLAHALRLVARYATLHEHALCLKPYTEAQLPWVKGLPGGAMGFVQWLVTLRPILQKSSWRLYKSAVIAFLAHPDNPLSDRLMALPWLSDQYSDACPHPDALPPKGNRKRIKNIAPETFAQFLVSLKDAPFDPFVIGLARTWLTLGALTGLRPHEWRQSEVIGPLSDADAIEGRIAGGVYLKIKNSKHTNGRAHGEFRHLQLNAFSEKAIEGVRQFVDFMGSLSKTQYEQQKEKVHRLLRGASLAFLGEGQGFIQLYTGRHRFASEMKNRFSPMEVAALMGHENTETAYAIYGRPKWGSKSGVPGVMPLESEVAKVTDKRGRQKKARIAPENAGGPTMEG